MVCNETQIFTLGGRAKAAPYRCTRLFRTRAPVRDAKRTRFTQRRSEHEAGGSIDVRIRYLFGKLGTALAAKPPTDGSTALAQDGVGGGVGSEGAFWVLIWILMQDGGVVVVPHCESLISIWEARLLAMGLVCGRGGGGRGGGWFEFPRWLSMMRSLK